MTALVGPIKFNASTGSDTQASGLGPATAVNSVNQGTTASYSGTTITFSGATDLSGVSAGHLLYLVTSTGRTFFAIASVNDGADSLTVDTAPTGTASGLAWAIGGKRKEFNETQSRKLLTADAKPGWIIETETDQTITSKITVSASGDTTGNVIIRGDSESAHRKIIQSSNDKVFEFNSTGGNTLENLWIQNSNGTKTLARGIDCFNCDVVIRNCIIGDTTNTLNNGLYRSGSAYVTVLDSVIQYCTEYATNGFNLRLEIRNCRINNNNRGINVTTNAYLTVDSSIVRNNTLEGIILGGIPRQLSIVRSVIHSNGGNGIDVAAGVRSGSAVIRGNRITSNGVYGILGGGVLTYAREFANNNAFWNNTSGEVSLFPNGANDITLTADPYVNAAANDYNINNDAGGGASLRAATVVLP